MKVNRNLIVVAIVLLILSVWAYRSSQNRAERFERGQPFLANLNPDEIAKIRITKGEDTVTLKRGEDSFTITEAKGYPAKNESVNRLIRSLLDMELERRVGSGEDLQQDLELLPGGDATTEVVLENAAEKEMVHFLVGKDAGDGTGSFVRRVDDESGTVFLTASRATINATKDGYLDKEIVDVKRDDIARISGADFEILDSDDGLKLQKVPRGREEKPSEMNRVKGVLSYLRYEEVFLADDPAVADLGFSPRIEVELKDGSGYRLALAERGEDSYLQIAGYHTVDRVTVNRDESDEELEEKAETLARADEMARFNAFHGSWVYKVTDAVADKIRLTKGDLVQEKES
jgi:hypothetical protein